MELRWFEHSDGTRVLQYRAKQMNVIYPFYGVEGAATERYDVVYTEWKDVPVVKDELKEYD